MPRTPAQEVELAVEALAAGGIVVVVDDADRENEGDLVAAASTVTTEQMAFIVRHTTGIICAPMTGRRADALGLPLMVEHNTDAHGTAFTVTVDHMSTGTGVSAEDRAATVRALASETTVPADLRRQAISFRCVPERVVSWLVQAIPRRLSTCFARRGR